jgi:hypothetical protein
MGKLMADKNETMKLVNPPRPQRGANGIKHVTVKSQSLVRAKNVTGRRLEASHIICRAKATKPNVMYGGHRGSIKAVHHYIRSCCH